MYFLVLVFLGQFEGDFLVCWKVDEDCYVLVVMFDGVIVFGQDLVIIFDEVRDWIRKFFMCGVF